MASTPPPHHPSASTDSLASSSGGGSSGGSNGKESRFNRLIHRLHGSNSSRDLSSSMMDALSNPSTPQRYNHNNTVMKTAAGHNNNSPALSDIDDIPLERPVFESKFMRELQQGASSSTSPTTSISTTRPPLAPSYSSPAAVIAHHRPSPPNNNNGPQHAISSRELERTRSSPIATSPSSASSSSLKSRLVRVASSNSLFNSTSKTTATQNNATSIGGVTSTSTSNNDNGDRSPSPSHLHLNLNHRKTSSLASNASLAGPSPSPRSRLAASVTTSNTHNNNNPTISSPTSATTSNAFAKSHAYRHSEDVRQYTRASPSLLDIPSSAYGKNHASSPPLSSSSPSDRTGRSVSPNLHALHERENEDGLLPSSSLKNNGMFSGLSVSNFSLNRKRSVDGLSLASNVSSQHLPIPEDEEDEEHHQDINEERQKHAHNEEDQTAKRNSGGSIEQKPSLATGQPETVTRPPLGERYLSSDRLPSSDAAASSISSKSTTPGFPRHMPSASYSSTYTNPSTSSSLYSSTTATNADGTAASTVQNQRTGLISSGLSESSRRFRSAFRLNKSRAAGMATPGGGGNEAAASLMGTSTTGTTRRAMRVPLKQQMGNEEEMEDNEESNATNAQGSVSVSTAANSTASPRSMEVDNDEKALSPTLTKTPQEVISHDYAHDKHPTPPTGPHVSHILTHDSGNASRSRSSSPRNEVPHHDVEHEAKEKELEVARERAQLVPLPASHASSQSLSSIGGVHKSRPVKVHALGEGSLRPGRALRVTAEQQHHDTDSNEEASPETGRSSNVSVQSHNRHMRNASSHGRLEDLMLVQEAGNIAHARPASRQQHRNSPPPALPPASASTLSAHHRNTSDNTLVATAAPPSSDASSRERERGWQVQPERIAPVHHRERHIASTAQETEEVLAIDGDKENAGAGDWYRQHRDKPAREMQDSEKGHHLLSSDRHHLAQQPSVDGLKSRSVLGQVRKPLQEQQANHQQGVNGGGFLPEPRQQGPLPQQHRIGKLSSSSSNGGLGYFPSDRQVVAVNDYAVPTKRSGDTPDEKEVHHHFAQPFPKQQQQQQQAASEGQHQYPYQHSRVAPPPSRPPPGSLPALPSLPSHAQQQQPQQQHDQQVPVQAPVQKRAPGTVTVQGKTYTRMGLLGRGGSSKVFRVCDKDHLVYALKKIDLGRGADNETYQAFLNEISLLEALRGHDRIIQLVAHEVNEAKRSLIMVMEIGEIDLNALLQERIAKGLPASMNFVRYMWEQMLEAVNVIHDEGIVHTDLKPANFVLVKGALKLIDFGIAKAIPNDTTNIARDQQIGTANYMSPEALNPHNSAKNGRVMKLGRPSDVWSLGCILYQMVYGHTPFGQIKNLAAKMNAIQTPGYAINFPTHAIPSTIKGEPLPDLAVRVEDDLLAVMKSCLRYDSKKRATIPELLMDPFLRLEGSGSRDENTSSRDGNEQQQVSLDMVSAIVKQTLNWSNGRQPTRGEQERFVEAILRQANGMIR